MPSAGPRAADTQARRELAAATLERLQADLELGTDFDMGSWIERAGEHLGHIQALLESPQSGQAGRVILRSIVPAPITITPIVDAATGKVREWEFRGEGDAAAIISGLLDAKGRLFSTPLPMDKILEKLANGMGPLTELISQGVEPSNIERSTEVDGRGVYSHRFRVQLVGVIAA